MQSLNNPAAVREFVQKNGTQRRIGPGRFEPSAGTAGSRERVARYRAGSLFALRESRAHPFKVAVPAYESFTSDSTGGNTETFTLSHSLTDPAHTQAVSVWIGGSYYGTPDSLDTSNDTIDVTDSGTSNTVHVFYTSDAGATLEVRKAAPSSSTKASQGLYEENLALVHNTDQDDQPEAFDLGETPLQDMVGTDMTLDVYVDAPYTVRFTDPDGDGAEATNALLSVPTMETGASVEGLPSVIKADMGQG
ncbi:hypothetical protein ACKVMT_10020 [Halobacteriales archaeon Cl-PHB]